MPSAIEVKGKAASSDDIRKAAASLGAEIKVGFLSGRQHIPRKHKNEKPPKMGMETCDLARMLHFGTPTIPERKFLEEGLLNAEDKIRKALEEELDKVTEGGIPNWGRVGALAVSEVQQFVNSDYYKSKTPNSPSTIKRKESDLPLVDSKDLINSMQFVVEKK